MSLMRLCSVLLFGLILMSSCEKKEEPISLPPQGEATIAVVDLGSDYRQQIFFSLEKEAVVMTSEVISWDIAFEAAPDGYHVFMNGGKEGSVYNSHQKDITSVVTPPKIAPEEWMLDAATGMSDSTAIGEWADARKMSKGDVYVLKFNASMVPDTFKKIKLVEVTPNAYTFEYGDLRSTETKRITVAKDDNYNFVYFSFSNGGQVVMPEPPKETWDIVFTRYRHIYHELDDFPYVVTGVLLNPYYTRAYEEELPFEEIDKDKIKPELFSNLRDIIGFDWKTYNLDKDRYTVASDINYIIQTSPGHVWKLHFLSYEGPSGEPGVPSFEFQRLK